VRYEAESRAPANVRSMNNDVSTVSSDCVFDGRVFDVRVDTVRYDDGTEHRADVVEHGPSIAIVATPTPGELVLVRQYRHPAKRMLWEIPAGSAEAGEALAAGALRELREETGYRAAAIRPIGATFMTPGFCDEAMYFFHADELSAGEQALDDDERIDVATFTVEAAWRLVASDEIADAKTVLALFWMESDRYETRGFFGR
jgi:ADP-ribose pyrophosphatase